MVDSPQVFSRAAFGKVISPTPGYPLRRRKGGASAFPRPTPFRARAAGSSAVAGAGMTRYATRCHSSALMAATAATDTPFFSAVAASCHRCRQSCTPAGPLCPQHCEVVPRLRVVGAAGQDVAERWLDPQFLLATRGSRRESFRVPYRREGSPVPPWAFP